MNKDIFELTLWLWNSYSCSGPTAFGWQYTGSGWTAWNGRLLWTSCKSGREVKYVILIETDCTSAKQLRGIVLKMINLGEKTIYFSKFSQEGSKFINLWTRDLEG